MVITGLTRNQVVLTGSWVRIPPAPPSKNPVTMRVSGFFLFCTRSKNHPILGCSFHCVKVVLRTHFRFESAAVSVPFPSALPLLQQLDNRIADLLVRIAFGEVFADVLPLEFYLLLLIRFFLRHHHHRIDHLIVQHALLRMCDLRICEFYDYAQNYNE